jgi:glycosyltransferase involved in cell wall biosynthesis
MDNLDALITFIVPCKGRLEHLKVCLPRLVAQQFSSVIVVDSNCPDGTATWVSANFPAVKIVRLNDDGIFNLGRSRNKGLEMALTKWVCFIDVDVVLKEGFVKSIAPLLDENTYYVFEHNPNKVGVFGSCIVPRNALNRIECYDEVFEGYGGDARDLYSRLERAGLKKHFLSHEFIDFVMQHPDALRAKYYKEKDIRISQSCNALYRLAKLNLSSLGGDCNLDTGKRRELYAMACETVKHALASPNHRAELKLPIPINSSDKSNFNLAQFERSVTLEIDLSRIVNDKTNIS